MQFWRSELSTFCTHVFLQYLDKAEYLKGIEVYESIIKTYASYAEDSRDGSLQDEL